MITIRDFKCVDDFELEEVPVVVLAGFNSAGKSSVIQALRILRWAGSQYAKDTREWVQVHHGMDFIDVRDPADLIRRGADLAEISGDFGYVRLQAGIAPGRGATDIEFDRDRIPGWMISEDFVYLSAERTGPRWESPTPDNDKIRYCGPKGEYTGKRLLDVSIQFPKIDPAKRCPATSTDNFQIQIDSWMSFIFGDVSFKALPISDSQARIMVRQPMGMFGAPGVGFGYTYSLPIIIDGLAVPVGSMMIVENPEAHLHPKAQSRMGYFLGTLAAAGVRVVVETHSEHIVNGIRLAVLSRLGLMPRDLAIYFFGEKAEGFDPQLITMDDSGNLSDFPVDFFDQVRQDMKEMWKMIAERRERRVERGERREENE